MPRRVKGRGHPPRRDRGGRPSLHFTAVLWSNSFCAVRPCSQPAPQAELGQGTHRVPTLRDVFGGPMSTNQTRADREVWPELPLAAWESTYRTLHMWSQIVGKVRLALSPRTNHWWEVPLYVNSVGLTTSPIPYGEGAFEIQFDFWQHKLLIQSSWGATRALALAPRSVADFCREFMDALASLGIEVKIWKMPCEVPD